MPQQVRVFLIPTVDCIDLQLIAEHLNAVQKVYQFWVLTPSVDEKPLRLSHTQALFGSKRSNVGEDEVEILNSYVGHRDWVSQLIQYVHLHCLSQTGSAFVEYVDLAIAIGAGLYVEDFTTTTYTCDVDVDVWSCLYDRDLTINADSSVPASLLRGYHPAAAVISLTTFENVFGVPYYDGSVTNRARVGRFLVENIAHFLGARSYHYKLARDHTEKTCVMETGISGGDIKKSYRAHGLCRECVALLERDPEHMLAVRTTSWYFAEVNDSLRALCDAPERWETFAGTSEFLRKRSTSFLLLAIIVSLATNLLAGWDITSYPTFSEYLAKHIPAFQVIGGTTVIFALGWGTAFLLVKQIPTIAAEPSN